MRSMSFICPTRNSACCLCPLYASSSIPSGAPAASASSACETSEDTSASKSPRFTRSLGPASSPSSAIFRLMSMTSTAMTEGAGPAKASIIISSASSDVPPFMACSRRSLKRRIASEDVFFATSLSSRSSTTSRHSMMALSRVVPIFTASSLATLSLCLVTSRSMSSIAPTSPICAMISSTWLPDSMIRLSTFLAALRCS
mmetsp:Transcript_56427/g.178541  ORF Transcript_56427/g.178541 Transcript_56427/m.178541 type:complete len:200 (-) Transcript_56427:285-884(-)